MASEIEGEIPELPVSVVTAPDPNDHFRTDHLQADLKGRSVRGGAVTVTAQGLKFSLTVLSTMVLARLLVPGDFGLVAMVTAVSGFVALFKDMGLSMATVQRAEINHGQISTLFWINVAISVAIGLLMAALAVPIAWFYGDGRLTAITLVLSLGMPLSGLGIQHQALLRRQMRFVALAVVGIVSMLSGIVAAIALAAVGTVYWPQVNYWSLVAIPLVTAAVGTIGVWWACRWRPGWPRRGSGVRAPLSFGGYLTAHSFVNYFSRNMDNVLIGYALGETILGLYSQAYRLLLLPITQVNPPVTAVAMPVLSRLVETPQRYRAFFLQGILIIVTLSMPIIAFAFVAADDFILLLLGSQWSGAAPIFRWLAPAAFVGTTNVVGWWVLLSTGRSDRLFRVSLFVTPCAVTAFLVGLYFGGAVGVAIAYSIANCLWQVPVMRYCLQGTPVCLADVGSVLWRPVVASLSAGVVTYLANGVLSGTCPLGAEVAIEAFVYGGSYLLITLSLPHGRASVTNMVRIFWEARKTGNAA